MRTLQTDFTSQHYFREPAASIEELRRFGPVISRIAATIAVYIACFPASPQLRRLTFGINVANPRAER
jgi:hypothetical protein